MKSFIDSIIPSIVAIRAASALDPAEEIDYLEDLAAKMQKELPNSSYTQKFATQMAAARRQVEADRLLAIGQTAPEISLKNPEDELIKLSSLQGKIVLIDFWASWCKPCRIENPKVVEMYQKYKDKGFEIYGVSLDESKEAWVKAIKDDNLTWLHVSDLKFWYSKAAQDYQVSAIPQTYLIDAEGKILAKGLRGASLEKKLAELLN